MFTIAAGVTLGLVMSLPSLNIGHWDVAQRRHRRPRRLDPFEPGQAPSCFSS